MLKILWHSNAPWAPTGYGNQTATFLWRIKGLGHDVMATCFYGLQGGAQQMDGILMLPVHKDGYGNDMLAQDAEYWQREIVITLVDNWVMHPSVTGQFRHVPWFPVDHDPMPPLVKDSLKTAYQPIVYSKFARAQCAKLGIPAMYVPHGVDVELYQPMPKAEARERTKIDPELFLVGIVAANKGNPSRKLFDHQIRAFADFWRDGRQDKAKMYIHSDFYGGYDGEDINRIAELNGLPASAILKPHPYKFARGLIGSEDMRVLYSAMDVLMNVTRGEGFGIPIVEAQACGTPVMVGDYTSMPELVGAGWKIPAADKFYSQMSYQFFPNVRAMTQALHQAYEARNDSELRETARDFILRNYDAELVTDEYWKPALEQIEERVRNEEARKAQRAALREQARKALTPGDGGEGEAAR